MFKVNGKTVKLNTVINSIKEIEKFCKFVLEIKSFEILRIVNDENKIYVCIKELNNDKVTQNIQLEMMFFYIYENGHIVYNTDYVRNAHIPRLQIYNQLKKKNKVFVQINRD